MKLQTLGLGILILVVLVWSGCDSEQYGEPTNTEPKTESTSTLTAEAPKKAGESSTVEGALPATEGAAGAEENDEGVNHYQQGHWDVAQEHFNKALATNADLPEAHYNLALALDKLGNHGGLYDLLHAYGHVRRFCETSFSATFLYPPRREVHACARHGPHFFGGLRSFMINPLLFESGTVYTVVFHKSQESNFILFEMLCLYLEDVNRFLFLRKSRCVAEWFCTH